jgi:hypothetical protein
MIIVKKVPHQFGGNRPPEELIEDEVRRFYPLILESLARLELTIRTGDASEIADAESNFLTLANKVPYYPLIEIVGLIREDTTSCWFAAINLILLDAGELTFMFEICESVKTKNYLVRERLKEVRAEAGLPPLEDELN